MPELAEVTQNDQRILMQDKRTVIVGQAKCALQMLNVQANCSTSDCEFGAAIKAAIEVPHL